MDTCVSTEELVDGKEKIVCDTLLTILEKHPGLVALVCETIAELAKKGMCISTVVQLKPKCKLSNVALSYTSTAMKKQW